MSPNAGIKRVRTMEMSTIVEKTIGMEEQLAARRDASIEDRVRAERFEKQLGETRDTLEEALTDLNNTRQINNELEAEIDQARRIVAANRQRVDAQAVLDQAT